jgi:UDP-N-acetylmuramoyl-L-alanyl-D-glutamate--2,6-diaminopimelate ligase
MIGYLTANHPLIDTFRLRRRRRTRVPDRRIKRGAVGTETRRVVERRDDSFPPVVRWIARWRACSVTVGACCRAGVFFALPGARTDGARHVDEAVRRGAVAVVGRGKASHLPKGVTYVEVADPRAALAAAAQRCFGFPDRAVGVVGVAGEGGKTTIAHLGTALAGRCERQSRAPRHESL